MTSVRQIWRMGRIVLLVLLGWLSVYGTAWAQQKSAEPQPTLNSSTYVMAYFLVIFAIALGILMVCRSSNRRERLRPDQFESKNFAEEEEKK
jgi:hypothetical protein